MLIKSKIFKINATVFIFNVEGSAFWFRTMISGGSSPKNKSTFFGTSLIHARLCIISIHGSLINLSRINYTKDIQPHQSARNHLLGRKFKLNAQWFQKWIKMLSLQAKWNSKVQRVQLDKGWKQYALYSTVFAAPLLRQCVIDSFTFIVKNFVLLPEAIG